MDMYAAYREVGSYRAAAQICGTTPKTVRRSVEAARRPRRGDIAPVRHNYDGVADLVAEAVARTKGRITAKRLLPVAVAAGYGGSAGNFRRLVAEAKDHGARRTTGEDDPACGPPVTWWSSTGARSARCSSSAPWSPGAGVRFVYFTDNLGAEATMEALAECFERMGGVPEECPDRPDGLSEGRHGRRPGHPDPGLCALRHPLRVPAGLLRGADPESKGLVENLVGYVKSDLMVPEQLRVADLARANEKARSWCDEVNGVVHSEICAVPAERLATERELFCPLPSLRAAIGNMVTRKVDRLSCVRFGSARYSVPNRYIGQTVELRVKDGVITVVLLGQVVATHLVVSPGETSIDDDHYGGPEADAHARSGPRVRRRRPSAPSVPQPTPSSKEQRPRDDRAGPGLRGAGPAGSHPRRETGDRRPRAGRGLQSVPGGRRGLHPQRRDRPPSTHQAGRGPDRRSARGAHPLVGRLRHGRRMVTRDATTPGPGLRGRAPPPAALGHPAALPRAADDG